MKKGADGTGTGGGGGGGGGGGKRSSGTTSVSMPCVLKFLAPEPLAAAIIGKGGAVIAAMRQNCQAKIALTEHGEVYPQTDCRVMTVQANAEQSLNEVSRQIIAKLTDLVKGSSASATIASEAVGHEGELKLRTLVPRAAVGGIMGKGGATIKQIRETSGAKIQISEPTGSSPGAEQLVSAAGTAQALEYVLTEVNRQIQLLNGEPWFPTWASATGVVSAAAGGYPGMGGSAHPMPMAMRGAPPAFGAPGVEVMMRVANSLPPYVMEDSRGFALSCVVPNRLVGGLIGRGGSGTKDVQNITGAKIGIREIPDDPDNRSLNIAGPLASTCAAYMLMMKRYLDAEAQSSSGGGQQPPR
mmetsp:Transcript_36226/g.77244  ORF Transcript_36226/g.77244 Transcript_36226/m.77244 type:complete len:356 (-) Transcript_36226:82-1149(-)